MTAALPQIAHAPRHGEPLGLAIARLGRSGAGEAPFEALVGPQEAPTRYLVEVPGALPGEVVEVTVQSRQRRRVVARPERWQVQSPSRETPRCPHFASQRRAGPSCGGCALQHLAYPAQLAAKEAWVRAALGPLLPEGGLRPIVGMAVPWYYRNKMEYSFGPSGDLGVALGLHPRGYRHEILPVPDCLLQSPFSAVLAARVGDWARERGLAPYRAELGDGLLEGLVVREGKRTGERLVELLCNDAVPEAEHRALRADWAGVVEDTARAQGERVSSLYWTRHLRCEGAPNRLVEALAAGVPALAEELHVAGRRLRFQIPPRAFFQPNTLQAGELLALCREAVGPVAPGGTVLDLYSGTGSFALAVADLAEQVVGVEIEPSAVAGARLNATLNQAENLVFFAGDAAQVLRELGSGPVRAVIVDPPRAGLDPDTLALVAGLAAERLCYVSCNLDALARDLARLGPLGYQTEWARPVDMFPHTPHVETVAMLTRRP